MATPRRGFTRVGDAERWSGVETRLHESRRRRQAPREHDEGAAARTRSSAPCRRRARASERSSGGNARRPRRRVFPGGDGSRLVSQRLWHRARTGGRPRATLGNDSRENLATRE